EKEFTGLDPGHVRVLAERLAEGVDVVDADVCHGGSWSGCGFLALVAPLHVAAPRVAIENPRGDEQQIGQAIQVTARVRADPVFLSERDHAALGAPAHRARKVRERGGARAAWQDELLERRQTCVPGLEPLLETREVRIA